MWILDVALQHHFCVGEMDSRAAQDEAAKLQSKAAVLPFRYQFAAGAVAGISEVSLYSSIIVITSMLLTGLDFGDVRTLINPCGLAKLRT